MIILNNMNNHQSNIKLKNERNGVVGHDPLPLHHFEVIYHIISYHICMTYDLITSSHKILILFHTKTPLSDTHLSLFFFFFLSPFYTPIHLISFHTSYHQIKQRYIYI
ncbi:hypothetical protein AAHE18_08G072300 [Arachis hypogaea]